LALTQARLMSGGRLVALALLGGITLNPVGAGTASAQAPTPQPSQQTWLSLQGPWLCRTWLPDTPTVLALGRADQTSGPTQVIARPHRLGLSVPGVMVHCTDLWHVDSRARLVSDAPDWVADPDGAWPEMAGNTELDSVNIQVERAFRRTSPVRALRIVKTQTRQFQGSTRGGGSSSGSGNTGYGTPGAWTPVPGHPSYGMWDFSGDPYAQEFGYCTWWAWYTRQGEPLMKLGSAANWPYDAPRYGLSVGSSPRVGATVVFQPGVEGASSGGHVGHVEAVLGGGWFVISEMNFYWNSGGWGRVDWRFAYVAPGVSFIY
jgi:surface antigen